MGWEWIQEWRKGFALQVRALEDGETEAEIDI